MCFFHWLILLLTVFPVHRVLLVDRSFCSTGRSRLMSAFLFGVGGEDGDNDGCVLAADRSPNCFTQHSIIIVGCFPVRVCPPSKWCVSRRTILSLLFHYVAPVRVCVCAHIFLCSLHSDSPHDHLDQFYLVPFPLLFALIRTKCLFHMPFTMSTLAKKQRAPACSQVCAPSPAMLSGKHFLGYACLSVSNVCVSKSLTIKP